MVPGFNWMCVWVWHCTSSICPSILYAGQDRVWFDALSLWCSTCTIKCILLCASASYAPCLGRTSVHICASSLQNVAVPQGVCLCQYLCWTFLVTPYSMVWHWRVSRAGPMLFYWPKLLAPFLSPTVFPFSSFILWVGVVGLGSSDW